MSGLNPVTIILIVNSLSVVSLVITQNETAKEDLSNLAGGIASMYVKKNVQRSNYYVISTYFLDMSLFRDFGRKDLEDIFVLGIFNFFLPLN